MVDEKGQGDNKNIEKETKTPSWELNPRRTRTKNDRPKTLNKPLNHRAIQ